MTRPGGKADALKPRERFEDDLKPAFTAGATQVAVQTFVGTTSERGVGQ